MYLRQTKLVSVSVPGPTGPTYTLLILKPPTSASIPDSLEAPDRLQRRTYSHPSTDDDISTNNPE